MKYILLLCGLLTVCALYGQTNTPTPEWGKNLIIYEIAPKGYTSPNGPGSGTFNSLCKKIPYLSDLGINSIWLSGHNLADKNHFFNVWTQFAVLRQDSIDPSLGTEADFKALIDEAHKHNIRVFLDVITHGVMPESSLIKEHSEWFRGGSYRMVDFDWYGNHPDMDQWWVDTFTEYVTKYGVDGFRVDVVMYRNDLWNRIRENAARAGHPIFIFAEGWEITDGASDMLQRLNRLAESIFETNPWNKSFTDMAEHYRDFRENNLMFRLTGAKVTYEDGTAETASIFGGSKLSMSTTNNLNVGNEPKKIKVRIDNINPEKNIRSIEIYPDNYLEACSVEYKDSTALHYPFVVPGKRNPRPMSYKIGQASNQIVSMVGLSSVTLEVTALKPDKILFSTQLSTHDNGWDRFPQGKNPYVAEGSRCILGYSCLLTPSIPLFFGGEEFNADYVPLPDHTRDLYGEKYDPGTGTWLYAGVICWDQLLQPEKQAVLKDVKRMISIRRNESDIFYARTSEDDDFIRKVSIVCTDSIPIPYLMFNERKAVIIAGNNQLKPTRAVLDISLEGTPLAGYAEYLVTDLWKGSRPQKISYKNLRKFPLRIGADKTPGGGLSVLKIEPVVP